MASDFEAQLKEEARPLLEPGEETKKSHEGAAAAGLQLTKPMALAVSDKRLLVFAIETSGMGKPKGVEELYSAVPLEQVEWVAVKRLLVGKTLTVSANGAEAKLEVGAGQDAKGLAEQFERAKASA